ncbi:MAG: serine/threonine-protein kinase [Albidovulum sp.]
MTRAKVVKMDGEAVDDQTVYPDELQPGTQLLGQQYTITDFLNSGGFGITYLAKDSLDRKVVIKECFSGAMCRRSALVVHPRSRAYTASFRSIVDLFMQEAQNQSKLIHPNIVGVHQVFKDNNTAYMALDHIQGADLLTVLEDTKRVTPKTVENWLRKMLDAMAFVHDKGVLHRDISPDNILIREDDEPILIDFGAAREQASKQERVLSTLRVVKDGYSPHEFYVSGSTQNATSDLYALAATFYHVLTGEAPTDSQARLSSIAQKQEDIYVPLEGRIEGYPDAMLRAIDKGLSVLPANRLPSARDWLNVMDGKAATVAQPTAAKVAEPASGGRPRGPVLVLSGLAAAAIAGVAIFASLGGDQDAAILAAPTATVSTAVAIPEKSTGSEEATTKVETVASDVLAAAVQSETPAAVSTGANFAVVHAGWTVELPFETNAIQVNDGTFAQVTMVRSDLSEGVEEWLRSGSVIYAINGTLVYGNGSIIDAITTTSNLAEQSNVTVTARIRSASGEAVQDQSLALPVGWAVELENGLRFVATQAGEDWQTRVVRIPRDMKTSLQLGDIIASEAQTGVVMQDAGDIEATLAALAAQASSAAYFTVTRKGQLTSASVPLTGS